MRGLRDWRSLHNLARSRHLHSAAATTTPTSDSSSQSIPPSLYRTRSNHHDLASFLSYATHTSLDPNSTIYAGTHYEYTVLQSLARLGFLLHRTGGVSDKGIDLLGTWALPSLPAAHPLKVLVQCKALKEKARPAVVRELEGAFVGAPAEWSGEGQWVEEKLLDGAKERLNEEADSTEARNGVENLGGRGRGVIGILVAPREATKGVRDAMSRSRWPMAYAKIDLGGRVEQLLWNKSAAHHGLEGVGIVTRHVPRKADVEGGKSAGETVMEKEVVLTWDREPWEWKSGR